MANSGTGKKLTIETINNRKGFALMIVIVIMLLASFLASQLILKVRAELIITRNIKARVEGNSLAEAGVNMAIFRLLDRPIDIPDFGEEEEWLTFIEGFSYEFYLPAGRVTYFATNESGKIDLNKSPRRLIELFLQYHLGGDEQEEQIATIIDSLMDWRDSDDLHRLNGAESEFYEELEDPYIARNGKIEDVNEFFLINGTELLAGKFEAMDVFSIHNSSKGLINFNSLTPAMLDFVCGGNKEAAAKYREAKKEFNGKLSRAVFSEIIGEERFGEFNSYLTTSSGSNKHYYIVGSGQPGLAELDSEDEEKPKKVPGSKNSILIKKSGAKFTYMTWQERYI